MALSAKVRVEQATSTELQVEDIFSSSLDSIFIDDTCNQHGDPGATVIYKSDFLDNDIKLSVPDLSVEDERRLFAHYLWNASIFMAMALELPPIGSSSNGHYNANGDTDIMPRDNFSDFSPISRTLAKKWTIENQTVLELGAGLGLAGIVAALTGASKTIISDYPTPELLKNLQTNVDLNIPKSHAGSVQVLGHSWGDFNDKLSSSYEHAFTRIIAADCFWMPWQHANLAKSMRHFISEDDLSARIYITAGYHTGRAKLASFFPVAEEQGLYVEHIEEVDVNGNTRAWTVEQNASNGENVTERKRWLAVAALMIKPR